jgi:hypothetical protein
MRRLCSSGEIRGHDTYSPRRDEPDQTRLASGLRWQGTPRKSNHRRISDVSVKLGLHGERSGDGKDPATGYLFPLYASLADRL